MIGQVKIDFIFGVVVFAIIIFFIVNQTNNLFSSLLTDSNADALKSKASSAINIIVSEQGDPANWESLPAGSVRRAGLASSPLVLSASKIYSMSYNCSNSDVYGNVLWNFEMKAYRLRVYNSTGLMLICGFDNLEPPIVSETKYVRIGSDYGTVILDLW